MLWPYLVTYLATAHAVLLWSSQACCMQSFHVFSTVTHFRFRSILVPALPEVRALGNHSPSPLVQQPQMRRESGNTAITSELSDGLTSIVTTGCRPRRRTKSSWASTVGGRSRRERHLARAASVSTRMSGSASRRQRRRSKVAHLPALERLASAVSPAAALCSLRSSDAQCLG